MKTIINIIISTITIVLAIPIMPHVIEDINPTGNVFFIMKQNLTRESNTRELVGVTYIIPKNGYCMVSIERASYFSTNVLYVEAYFNTLERAIIWQNNEIKKYKLFVNDTRIDILRGGDDKTSRNLDDLLTRGDAEGKVALAKAIRTNTKYIGYVDTYYPLITAYLKEYREHENKDISCFDPNQINK
jgi:hypothetical protein